MRSSIRKHRVVAAIACLVACVASLSYLPAFASSVEDDDARALSLLNKQSCADRNLNPQGSVYVGQLNGLPTPTPTPSASPVPTPTFGSIPGSNTTLFATPRPSGSPGTTPPPVPSATPNPFDQNQPVMVQRGGDTPPPITPAGVTASASPTPSGSPSAAPTLGPNYIAVLADKVYGSTTPGQQGDAEGNVHMLYGAEEMSETATYDGLRTVTITGHPFIINHAHDSVLLADKIEFDTIDQTAKLTNGRGTSSEGVERGLVHFTAKDLHTDANGVGHGLAPSVSTCENPRGGYHMTGRNMDVYPGDKIVIYHAILWLGAAAIFFPAEGRHPATHDRRRNAKAEVFSRRWVRSNRRLLDQDAHYVWPQPILLRLLHRRFLHEGRPRPWIRRVLHQTQRPSQRVREFLYHQQ